MRKSSQAYAVALAGLVLFALLVFREVLWPGHTLLTTDDNIGALAMRKGLLPWGWWSGWYDGELFGFAAPLFINLTNLLLYLLPATTFNNWINAFDLVMGSFFLLLFLRGRGIGWLAAILGLLTAYWLGSNFTLVYAGHIGKFGVLMWVPICLWLADQAAAKRCLYRAILAGGAMGAMFLEQADVALFFALFIGPYILFNGWRTFGGDRRQLARLILPLLAIALLLAVHPLLAGYQTAVEDVAALQDDSPDAQWDFVTQWSWPPEETIDFIAPGYFGWRTGEPQGLYVGRMGQSAAWLKRGEEFPNFKLENQYLGAIPVFFAFLAVYFSLRFRRTLGPQTQEVWFWSIAALVAFLLALGKFFPLYALFYQLPIVSSIRNPNKFLQVFQLAFAILSAYGLHLFLEKAQAKGRHSLLFRDMLPVISIGFAAGIALLVWSSQGFADRNQWIQQLIARWNEFAEPIPPADQWQFAADLIDTRINGLIHGGVMFLVAATFVTIILWRRALSQRFVVWSVAALITVVGIDALLLGRHYVRTLDFGTYRDNPIPQILNSDATTRTALITRAGFYNEWLSVLFPYHGISTIEITQMPRMPNDYRQYLSTVPANIIRHWELGAVRFILGDHTLWQNIDGNPMLRDRFGLVFAYNVVEGQVVAGSPEARGEHVVIQNRAPHPRYALISAWEVMPDAEVLQALVQDSLPFQRVLIAPAQDITHLPPSGEGGMNGTVSRREYRPGYAHLRVAAEQASILRLADRFDRHWQVELNGQRVPLLRVDYIFQGVYIPAGMHDVVLRYRPPRTTLWIQIAGLLLCAGTGLLWLRRARRQRANTEPEHE
jgi:hypothetical protein